jgi:transcriptional regulator of aromatic amino acid metabolism
MKLSRTDRTSPVSGLIATFAFLLPTPFEVRLNQFADETGSGGPALAHQTVKRLHQFSWHGNLQRLHSYYHSYRNVDAAM